jgi:DNA primase
VVRGYYQSEMRNRLDRRRQAERPVWQPRRGPGSRPGGRRFPPGAPEEVPPSAGTEARQVGLDLDGSRKVRMLLGALIERPAMLHILAEDVALLPTNLELERLQRGLLDALSLTPLGVDPAADEAADGVPLEARLIADHLQRNGLGPLAEAARLKAREIFRNDPTDAEAWVDQWRRTAQHLTQRRSDQAELQLARQRFAEEPNEENAQHLEAVIGRMRRAAVEASR